MLISFSRHLFSHQQKTDTGVSELQWLALLVSLVEGDKDNCPGLHRRGVQGHALQTSKGQDWSGVHGARIRQIVQYQPRSPSQEPPPQSVRFQ